MLAFFRSLPQPDLIKPGRYRAYLILVASAPAALIGFFFEGFFETAVRLPWLVALYMVIVGVPFLVAGAVGRGSRESSKLTFRETFGIGFVQPAALILKSTAQGLASRSGCSWA